MPKIPSLKPIQVIKAYKRLGFIEHHQTGSHCVLYHPVTRTRAVIPIHPKDIKRGTLRAILRESRIDTETFLNALRRK